MWLKIGTPKNIIFHLGQNGKVVGLGVPIHKHFRMCNRLIQNWLNRWIICKFYVLSNSISVISRQLVSCNERLCAMEPSLWLKRSPPKVGLKPETTRLVGQSLIYWASRAPIQRGWSGGAMVLGKLPVPGYPTIWMTVGQGPISLAIGAGGGCLDIFTLLYPFS